MWRIVGRVTVILMALAVIGILWMMMVPIYLELGKVLSNKFSVFNEGGLHSYRLIILILGGILSVVVFSITWSAMRPPD